MLTAGRLIKYYRFFNNRSSSQDLDYFLNSASFGNKYEGIRAEMQRLIGITARTLKYDIRWANDEVRAFLSLLNRPDRLFAQSKARISSCTEMVHSWCMLCKWSGRFVER